MPRDISGNYTLPIGNPVVVDTTITTDWGNDTMNDIAAQLNNVVTKDGVVGPTGPLRGSNGTAAAPAYSFTSDTNIGNYRIGADVLGWSVAGVEAMRLSTVGLGLSVTPANGFRFEVNGTSANSNLARFSGATVQTRGLELSSFAVGGTNGVGFLWEAPGSTAGPTGNGTHAWGVGGAEYMRLDNNNQLAIGHTTGFTILPFSAIPRLSVIAAGAGDAGEAALGLFAWHAATTTGARISAAKSRGNTPGTRGIVSSGDIPLNIISSADDGVDFIPLAAVHTAVDGTPGVGDMPGRIVFSVTRDGANAVTEAMRISNTGQMLIAASASGSKSLEVQGTSGDPTVSTEQSLSGGTLIWQLHNLSNTASSQVLFNMSVAGGTAGDVTQRMAISGLAEMCFGYDNSDSDCFKWSAGATLGTGDRFGIETDGRIWAGGIHNVGTVTGTTKQFFASGTYTATLTGVTNFTSGSAEPTPWKRTGNVVEVGVFANITPTAAAPTLTNVGVSLPIASNIGNIGDCCGATHSTADAAANGMTGMISGDAANNRANLQFYARVGTPQNHTGTFVYVII